MTGEKTDAGAFDIEAKAREIALPGASQEAIDRIADALRDAVRTLDPDPYQAGYRAGLELAAEIADEEIAREAWLEGLAIAAVSKAIRAEMGKDNEST